MPWDEVDARLLEHSVSRLRDMLIGQQLDISERRNGDRIVRLPKPAGADYAFELWIYGPDSGGSGGRHIGATLPGRSDTETFWGCPFEPESFFRTRKTTWTEARERLADAFDEMVRDIVRLPTRIIQSRGLLHWRFTLQVETLPGSWKSVCSSILLRLGFRVAPIQGRMRVYASPAIAAN
ncbi:MAG TPA: hypothetical protein VE620_11370 [Myxococcales bacterium]|nr:hypothetical protein [Myxococcales bacterium]